jgi:CDP-diacylglycerol--glycerol-3-phosphate 3-phosphatidyltransferase
VGDDRCDGPSWVALAMWIVLASTDGSTAGLARRMGTTRSGAFLDPLGRQGPGAGAMWAIVAADWFWWLPVALITCREVRISVFRSTGAGQGLAVPPATGPRSKTVVHPSAVASPCPAAASDAGFAGVRPLVADGLTLVTGAQYCSRAAGQAAPAGRGQARQPSAAARRVASRDRGGGHRACSARSSTPTRPGWASSWPWPASTHHRPSVGDNLDRIVDALELALARADCRWSCAAASGPPRTTSPARRIAEVHGRADGTWTTTCADRILELFASPGRRMPANNMRSGDGPRGRGRRSPTPSRAPHRAC